MANPWEEVPTTETPIGDNKIATSPGIVEAKLGDTTAATFDPTKVDVTPESTVESRIQGLIEKNSPLMQMAATQAKQSANAQGLLNSSMAVQAGQQAVYSSALPIASQDATTFANAATQDAAAANRAKEVGALGIQSSALQKQQGDISSKLQSEKAEIDKALITANGAEQERLLVRQGEIDFGLVVERGVQDGLLLDAQFKNDSALEELRYQQSIGMVGVNTQAEKDLLATKAEIDKGLLEIQQANEVVLQQLRGDQATTLATLDANARVLSQTSNSAAIAYSQISAGIAEILTNPDIDATTKPGLVDKMLDLLEGSLTVIGATGDIDLAGLLDFGEGSVGEVGETPPPAWTPWSGLNLTGGL